MIERRYFERKEHLKAQLAFLMNEALEAYNKAKGEPNTFQSEINILVSLYGALDQEIDEDSLNGISDKIARFKSRIDLFLKLIKPYLPQDEISKKDIN